MCSLLFYRNKGVAVEQEGNPREGDEGEDVAGARGAHQEPSQAKIIR